MGLPPLSLDPRLPKSWAIAQYQFCQGTMTASGSFAPCPIEMASIAMSAMPRLRPKLCGIAACRDGPRLCEKSHRCYDSARESVSGSAGCQASWKGLIGAKAVYSQLNLKTM